MAETSCFENAVYEEYFHQLIAFMWGAESLASGSCMNSLRYCCWFLFYFFIF